MNKFKPDKAVAVVLAGGKSERMGSDKASLLFGGQPMLVRTCLTLSAAFETIAVSVAAGSSSALIDKFPSLFKPDTSDKITEESINKSTQQDRHSRESGNPSYQVAFGHLNKCEILTFEDEFPGRGPVGGIHAAMKSVESEFYFFTGCDMPFLDIRLASIMIERTFETAADVVIPRMADGRLHPLHAVYRGTCLPFIDAQLRSETSNRIIAFFDNVKVEYFDEPEIRKLDPALRCLMNLNTPDDLRIAREILESL